MKQPAVKRRRYWNACGQYPETENRLLCCWVTNRVLNVTGFHRAFPVKKSYQYPAVYTLPIPLPSSQAWGRGAFTGELVRALTWSTVSELSKQMVQGEIECSSCLPRPKASNYCLILAGGLNYQNYHRCMHRVEWMCRNLSLRVWKQKIRL